MESQVVMPPNEELCSGKIECFDASGAVWRDWRELALLFEVWGHTPPFFSLGEAHELELPEYDPCEPLRPELGKKFANKCL